MSTPTTIGRNNQGRQAAHLYGASPNESVEGFQTYSQSGFTSKHIFKSNRLKGEYEKPWLQNKAMKATRWNDLIVGSFILAGLCGAGVIGFFTVRPFIQGDVRIRRSHYLMRPKLISFNLALPYLRGQFRDTQH